MKNPFSRLFRSSTDKIRYLEQVVDKMHETISKKDTEIQSAHSQLRSKESDQQVLVDLVKHYQDLSGELEKQLISLDEDLKLLRKDITRLEEDKKELSQKVEEQATSHLQQVRYNLTLEQIVKDNQDLAKSWADKASELSKINRDLEINIGMQTDYTLSLEDSVKDKELQRKSWQSKFRDAVEDNHRLSQELQAEREKSSEEIERAVKEKAKKIFFETIEELKQKIDDNL
jgi:predicted  nucleic acid-binding Zn-ribbon protein